MKCLSGAFLPAARGGSGGDLKAKRARGAAGTWPLLCSSVIRGDDGHGKHPEKDHGSDGSGAFGDPGRAHGADTPVEAEPVNPSLTPLPPVTSTEEAPSAEEPWRTVRSPTSVREDLFETDEVSLADEPGALRRPANDDRESIGQILRTL